MADSSTSSSSDKQGVGSKTVRPSITPQSVKACTLYTNTPYTFRTKSALRMCWFVSQNRFRPSCASSLQAGFVVNGISHRVQKWSFCFEKTSLLNRWQLCCGWVVVVVEAVAGETGCDYVVVVVVVEAAMIFNNSAA